MAAFDESVKRVAESISKRRVLLSERIRAGRKRHISVGPYKTATNPKTQFALCILPALPGGSDCIIKSSANGAAREFVRLVGPEEARDSLRRESRKRNG